MAAFHELQSDPSDSSTSAVAAIEDQTSQSSGFERRDRPRLAYPYLQWIAPRIDGESPPRSAFVEVQCRDISAGGFAYLAAQEPINLQLVIALGAGSSLTCLSAEVIQTTSVDHEGKKMYLVGCRYTGRPVY